MVKMPEVKSCSVGNCAYNNDNKCHAIAITVGDGTIPHCDTAVMGSASHGGVEEIIAGVGACKVSGCKHNNNLVCGAPAIAIGRRDGEILCMTFSSR